MQWFFHLAWSCSRQHQSHSFKRALWTSATWRFCLSFCATACFCPLEQLQLLDVTTIETVVAASALATLLSSPMLCGNQKRSGHYLQKQRRSAKSLWCKDKDYCSALSFSHRCTATMRRSTLLSTKPLSFSHFNVMIRWANSNRQKVKSGQDILRPILTGHLGRWPNEDDLSQHHHKMGICQS